MQLITIRNPWGSGEWKGAWGDDSALWHRYPSLGKTLGMERGEDGVFVMQWDDFEAHIQYLCICGNDLW